MFFSFLTLEISFFLFYRYQSVLYFHSLTLDDSGIYICRKRFSPFIDIFQKNFIITDAENAMNRTTASILLNIDDHHQYQSNKNVTCSSLKYCHNRGQCIIIERQLKCL